MYCSSQRPQGLHCWSQRLRLLVMVTTFLALCGSATGEESLPCRSTVEVPVDLSGTGSYHLSNCADASSITVKIQQTPGPDGILHRLGTNTLAWLSLPGPRGPCGSG